jgi:L-amino acid N-acyltransferase
MLLRGATENDLEEILQIYNDVIVNTTATFEEVPRELSEWVAIYKEKQSLGYPLIVATIEQKVVGYGSYGVFRKASRYRSSVEHSIHMAPEYRGKGYGSQILQELIHLAQKQKLHAMIAAIDASNASSVFLHRKLGFKIVGEIPQVAYKFSRWLDLTLMQLILEQV